MDLFLAAPALLPPLAAFLVLLLGVAALWGVPAASPPWAATAATGAALLAWVVLFLAPPALEILLDPAAFFAPDLLTPVFLAACFAIT